MDLVRLARLFSSPCPVRLSILQHLNPLGAQWAGGREWLAMWQTWPVSAFSSFSCQLPPGQGNQKNMSSLPSNPSQPSSMDPQEEEEEESFGTLSNKYSSRRLFRKSTAQLYNLQLREQNAEEDEEGKLEPKSWQGRKNTPYWYFFQCKRLIKEGKVRSFSSCWGGYFVHLESNPVFSAAKCWYTPHSADEPYLSIFAHSSDPSASWH